jgi:hypothetical protein
MVEFLGVAITWGRRIAPVTVWLTLVDQGTRSGMIDERPARPVPPVGHERDLTTNDWRNKEDQK